MRTSGIPFAARVGGKEAKAGGYWPWQMCWRARPQLPWVRERASSAWPPRMRGRVRLRPPAAVGARMRRPAGAQLRTQVRRVLTASCSARRARVTSARGCIGELNTSRHVRMRGSSKSPAQPQGARAGELDLCRHGTAGELVSSSRDVLDP
jgi:hypothetical protein